MFFKPTISWGEIFLGVLVLSFLVGCGRVVFIFEYGSPLKLQENAFTISDGAGQKEIAYAFIHSVAFHKVDGIKQHVDISEQDDLERLVAQIKPANNHCRIPFDQVLSYSSSSHLKESISIEYICPSEENFIKFNSYVLSTTLYIYEDEKGNLVIKHWCDTSQGSGTEIGLSCHIKNLRNP